MPGVGNKDKEFWKGLEEWDIIILMETWVEERGWNRVREKLPGGHYWEAQWARREETKGRAMGGMIMGVRKGIELEGGIEGEKEGIMRTRVKTGEGWWRVIGVYVNRDLERKLEELGEWIEGREKGTRVVIGGDLNARTGREGGEIVEEEEEEGGRGSRRSKDEKVNAEGRRLCGYLGGRGWGILNGNMKGDEEGEWTFVGGRGSSVIVYILGNEETREGVERMEVGDRIDSDHAPLTVWLKGERPGRRGKEGGGKRMGRCNRGISTEEGTKEFRERFGKRKEAGEGVEEDWKGLKDRIKEALGGREKDTEVRSRGWWDKECREEKRKVREELRRWRKRGGEGIEYRAMKGAYKVMCEEKKGKEREKWEKELEGVKTEKQVWEVINRERRRRTRVDERIKMEEWDEHFRGLLGGVEWRVRKGGVGRRSDEGEKDIEKSEIIRVIKGLKEKKAAGSDGIANEIWKHGGSEVEEWLGRICNRVWRGEGWLEEWTEGIVVPIAKKGDSRRVENYRGVTLLQSAYKVYAAILAERLRVEVEEKGMLPASQTRFRKGVGCVDNIYVLNYLINRQVVRKNRKMVILFVDLKAAFDSVDREILVGAMRKRGVREGLVERFEEILKETKSKVRVGGEEGDSFWTARGVRQGCPLSPLLFTLLMADMDEELGKGGWGRVKVRGRKVFTLAYADDVAMVAEEEDEMRGMIGVLERYLEERGLQLNAEKSKVMRCRRGGGRWKKVSWRWKGKVLEEMSEYRYLGYVITRDGGQRKHVEDRIRKGAAVMGQVWGIGKRRFGKDWERRIWLYDKLVWSVVGYGVEIWGWKERERLESLHERYLRWVLGVERCTPGYMVREEVQRELMRGRAGLRAWGYENKLREGKGGELARLCWEEVRERGRRGRTMEGWEKERLEFWEEKGWTMEEAEEMMEKRREIVSEEIVNREKERQRVERWERIREASYNRWYGMVKEEGLPSYLGKGWGESRWQRVARFRLGNEMRGGKYWLEEGERMCRMCGWEIESWEHVWEVCMRGDNERGWQEMMREVLGDGGEGEEWMRKVEEWRERKSGSKDSERMNDRNRDGMARRTTGRGGPGG